MTKMPNILNDKSIFSRESIKRIEDRYNAKWIVDSAVPLMSQDQWWSDSAAAIFYTETPHPQGSNYFGIIESVEGFSILNAKAAVDAPFVGLLIDDDIVFSRYRHDFREHKGVFVDGGRDYFRYGGERMDEAKKVHIKVVKDRLIVEDEIG